MIDPGSRTSLQKHMHRSEHLIVVKGTATIAIGDRVKIFTENESVYVPLGKSHRISNEGRIPLELIEVRTGGYLAEDDIIRLEDDYSRKSPEPATTAG
jgi:mannose-1-phosphate guanylyltransferase/mannose-1-phosphate guanylyltransferase/mannose-6-phosphate isomerase